MADLFKQLKLRQMFTATLLAAVVLSLLTQIPSLVVKCPPCNEDQKLISETPLRYYLAASNTTRPTNASSDVNMNASSPVNKSVLVCPKCACKTAATQLPVSNKTVSLPSVCMDEGCRSDYVRQLHIKDEYPIPAIRHILWKSELVSEYFAEQLRTWQIIHPDWTFVLWRDQDLEPFVAFHFPGLLAKFKSLNDHIMRVDMIRYMILFKYGGTYADLDYRLVKSLDEFRRFHAVVTREPEAHSLAVLGMVWPPKLMASPAFMMSAPGHTFHFYAMRELVFRATKGLLEYAGPVGLTEMIETYSGLFPIASNALEAIFVPPSYSFYPYPENKMSTSKSEYKELRIKTLNKYCDSLKRNKNARWEQLRRHRQLVQYCTDVNNMDPITDKSQPVFAVHDLMKSGAAYHEKGVGKHFYNDKPMDIRRIVNTTTLGKDFMKRT